MITAAYKAEWLRNNQKPGETYAGLVLGQDGQPDYHLFALPKEAVGVTWKEALAWAKKQGASLPDRREQRLLWVNARDAFAKEWYWSSEQHAADSDYAWLQSFDGGNQRTSYTDNRLRARAVRRVPI